MKTEASQPANSEEKRKEIMRKQTFRGKSAVIDVGSNSVRLMVLADGKVLYKTLQTTRLGEGLAFSSVLNSSAQERTAEAIAELKRRAESEGAEKIFAYATAAVREAENREEFLTLAEKKSGVKIEVLSGEREATLGLDGALRAKDGATVDIGGASTEIAVRLGGKTAYKKSVPVGVVRIKDTCDRCERKIRSFCLLYAEEFFDAKEFLDKIGGKLTAIGGTATTLGAKKAALSVYDGKKVTGTTFSPEETAAMAEELLRLPVKEIEKMPCMPKKRADVIGGGAAWLAILARALGVKKIVVSDEDNLEGYAMEKGLL